MQPKRKLLRFSPIFSVSIAWDVDQNPRNTGQTIQPAHFGTGDAYDTECPGFLKSKFWWNLSPSKLEDSLHFPSNPTFNFNHTTFPSLH